MTGDNFPVADTPLSATNIPYATVELIRDAVVVPVGETGLLPCGVFRPDGSFCEHSRTLLSGKRFTDIPAHPSPQEIETCEGRHLYAGLGRRHFGHFLLESIGRLWALERSLPGVDSVVLTPINQSRLLRVLMKQYQPFYQAISYDTPFYLTDRPLRISELLVPTQGFGHRNWITGTPEFRAFIRQRLNENFIPAGPEKLYISRSRLRNEDKLVDQEARIERLMAKAGYTIFHPQLHSIDVQCQHYMAARYIVGADGSAFHFAALALQSGTKVALIKRRDRQSVFQSFATQLRAFCDLNLTTIDPTIPPKISALDPPPPVTPINFRHLKRKLAEANFI